MTDFNFKGIFFFLHNNLKKKKNKWESVLNRGWGNEEIKWNIFPHIDNISQILSGWINLQKQLHDIKYWNECPMKDLEEEMLNIYTVLANVFVLCTEWIQ